MQPLPPSYGRRGRLALLGAALLVLLALVAFASRSGFGGSGSAAPDNTYVSYAMTVFLIMFVLMIPLAIYSYVMRVQEFGTARSAPNRRFMRFLLLIVALGVGIYLRHWLRAKFGQIHHGGLFHHDSKLTQTGKLHGKNGAAPPQPHFEWPVLWGFVAAGFVVLVAGFVMRARRPPPETRIVPTMEEDVAAEIADAIDDLEAERDPRRAVIAAYARMERVLGRHGLERRKSETAIEYLRRVLLDLTTSGAAVERLTSLFERANFSKHDVSGAMKQDAIASLREIREGIAV